MYRLLHSIVARAMPLFSPFGLSKKKKTREKTLLCESDAYASHESRIGVPKDSSSRKEEKHRRRGKGYATTYSGSEGRGGGGSREGGGGAGHSRREFAEFWLGEHTSGHYRSLST